MPLSEHEQRLLDQIERALYQEDPKFASTVRATDLRTHMRRRLRRAALVLALGFVLLLTGVVSKQYAVGIAGFVVMVGALLLAMTSWKRPRPAGTPDLHVAGAPSAAAPRATAAAAQAPPSGGSERPAVAGAARGALEAPLGGARRRRPLTHPVRRTARLPERGAASPGTSGAGTRRRLTEAAASPRLTSRA